MQQWEYCELYRDTQLKACIFYYREYQTDINDDWVDAVNLLGVNGWELVAIDPETSHFYFKRQLGEDSIG